MESEEPRAILYDFFFIDQERVRSLYAQLFSGLLAGVDMLTGEQHKHVWQMRAGSNNLAALISQRESAEDVGKTEHISPHDLMLHDVLAALRERDMICRVPASASPGSLLLLHGTLGLLDFKLLEGAVKLLPDMARLNDNAGQRGKTRKKADFAFAGALKKIVEVIPWGMTMVLQTAEVTAWGAINRALLRADPGHMVLQSGPVLPGEWYLLAVVDAPVSPTSNTIKGLPELHQGLLSGLAGMRAAVGMPEGFIGVTPLLIFRKIPPAPASDSISKPA